MKVFLAIIKYIAIVILTISIIILVFVNIVSSTIMDKKYIISKLEETNYYSGMYKEIELNFEKYIHQSGLDEVVIKDLISEEKVKSDVNIMINNIYDGTNQKIDVTEIKDKLNTNIENSIENKKLTITAQESINAFVEKICQEYIQTMTHTEYEQNINNTYMKLLKNIQILQKVMLITILLSILIILAISRKRIFKGVSNIGIALTSSGAFYIFINFFINSKIKIETITIFNEAITITLRNILIQIVNVVMNYGYILLLSGIIVVIAGSLVDSIKEKTNKKI